MTDPYTLTAADIEGARQIVLGLLCKKLIAHADAHPEHITP